MTDIQIEGGQKINGDSLTPNKEHIFRGPVYIEGNIPPKAKVTFLNGIVFIEGNVGEGAVLTARQEGVALKGGKIVNNGTATITFTGPVVIDDLGMTVTGDIIINNNTGSTTISNSKTDGAWVDDSLNTSVISVAGSCSGATIVAEKMVLLMGDKVHNSKITAPEVAILTGDVTGGSVITAPSGQVKADSVTGGSTINAASGHVTVDSVTDSTINAASGHVTAKNVTGSIINAASGKVTADNVTGSSTINAISGSVETTGEVSKDSKINLHPAPQASIELRAMSPLQLAKVEAPSLGQARGGVQPG